MCIYIYIYMYVYVCMCIYIYIYICIYKRLNKLDMCNLSTAISVPYIFVLKIKTRHINNKQQIKQNKKT